MRRRLLILGALLAAFGAAATPAAAQTASRVLVSVGTALPIAPVPSSFLGLSLEWYELPGTVGTSAATLNPIFPALVRLLDPSGNPSLRLGGESADWTWVPTPGVRRPLPVNETITPALESALAATARNLDARYLLDLNLAADNPRLSSYEANSLINTIGGRYIRAFEIGNEPELYGALSWSRPPLAAILARPHTYNLTDYRSEFNTLAAHLPNFATAGPASGNPAWATSFAADRTAQNHLTIITVHRYALPRCNLTPKDPTFPTVAKLLAPSTAFSLAAGVAPLVAAVHAHHMPLRVDELNSAPCFGVPGVSNTFASALWALQSAFALAETGVDGINVHTVPAAAHRLFSFWQTKGVWHADVFPEYYGLLMFSEAAPVGSQMMHTTTSSPSLNAWATQTSTADRLVLVNTGPTRTVSVTVPGAGSSANAITLTAPSASATSGTTLAGSAIPNASTTGQFSPAPVIATLTPTRPGQLTLQVGADSAVMIGMPR